MRGLAGGSGSDCDEAAEAGIAVDLLVDDLRHNRLLSHGAKVQSQTDQKRSHDHKRSHETQFAQNSKREDRSREGLRGNGAGRTGGSAWVAYAALRAWCVATAPEWWWPLQWPRRQPDDDYGAPAAQLSEGLESQFDVPHSNSIGHVANDCPTQSGPPRRHRQGRGPGAAQRTEPDLPRMLVLCCIPLQRVTGVAT